MTQPEELRRLVENLSLAVSAHPAELERGLTAGLREAVKRNNWLPPDRRRASHDRYARHLLYGDPDGRFSILAIVWDHGQASPIHGHHTWCALGVYSGKLVETLYADTTDGAPVPTRTVYRNEGTVSFTSAAGGIHRIANDSGAAAVSLHVYGVAQDRISTGINRLYG